MQIDYKFVVDLAVMRRISLITDDTSASFYIL